MSDLRAAFEDATDHVTADLEDAVLGETRRRRRRHRTVSVVGAVACVVLISVALGRAGGVLDVGEREVGPVESPSAVATPTGPSGGDDDGPATQPEWDPYDLADVPLADSALTRLLPADGRLEPDVEPGADPIEQDPMAGVVVAWSEKGAGTRLLGTDGRWRSAPAGFESNTGTPYGPGPPAISADGTRVAVALRSGIAVLDVTDGETRTLTWPDRLAPPWDSAPGLRWLPGDEGLLVEHWQEPWVMDLDGTSRPLGYARGVGASGQLGLDPDGPIYENDYRRTTLVTRDGDRAVLEAPFVQCERLVAADGLVACTTGSLDSGGPSGPGYTRSGPVVVEAATGDVLGYAPIRDPASLYSDNGGLTALGFLDPGTVLLAVQPRRAGASYETRTTHLVAWGYLDGGFERLATADEPLDAVLSIAPALVE